MTDADTRKTIREVRALLEVEWAESIPTPAEHIRECAHAMTAAAELLFAELHAADEKELAEARARVAEIEARLKVAAAPRVESKPSPTTDYEQTDAGMGIGGGREPAQSADDFRDELHELRERGVEKRRKRGI